MSGVFRFAAVCFILIGMMIGLCAVIGGPDGPEATNIILAGLVTYISTSLFFAFRLRSWSINRVEGSILLVLLWFVMPLPVAISIMQSTGLSFVDAMFEATSALTTTGATVFSSLDELPKSVLFLRSLMQWFGGLLTLLGVVMILAPAGLGGLPTHQATLINRENTFSRNSARAAGLTILGGYTFLTVVCFLSLLVSQVSVFDAFALTLTTVSTGGLLSSDTPLSDIGSDYTSFVLAFFMMMAGTSIVWQRYLFSGRGDLLKMHRETYYYIGAILVLGLIYAATFFNRAGSSDVLTPVDALKEGLFTAASLISTTGFEIRNGSFSVLPAAIALMVVLVGGCSFSTAGGISFYRVGGMLTHSFKDLAILVYPSSVHPSRFGSQRYDVHLIKAIWVYFFAVSAVVMLGTVFLALRLESFDAALIASIAAFSNIGAFYSTGWSETGQWQSFSQLDAFSKGTLCVLMILGRLHILALLTAFNKTYWLNSR